MENKEYLKINLLETGQYNNAHRANFEAYRAKTSSLGFTDTNEALNLKAGDIIEFISGYNDDILYTTEILAFDKDGDIYVLWDCYWFPINGKERNVKKVL